MDSGLARSSLPLLLRSKRRKRVRPIMSNNPLWRNRAGALAAADSIIEQIYKERKGGMS
jgi:hypothetical protein